MEQGRLLPNRALLVFNNSPGLSKAKILIVDDEKDITAILKSGLQKHGFSVDAFNEPRGPFAFHLRTLMEL